MQSQLQVQAAVYHSCESFAILYRCLKITYYVVTSLNAFCKVT